MNKIIKQELSITPSKESIFKKSPVQILLVRIEVHRGQECTMIQVGNVRSLNNQTGIAKP